MLIEQYNSTTHQRNAFHRLAQRLLPAPDLDITYYVDVGTAQRAQDFADLVNRTAIVAERTAHETAIEEGELSPEDCPVGSVMKDSDFDPCIRAEFLPYDPDNPHAAAYGVVRLNVSNYAEAARLLDDLSRNPQLQQLLQPVKAPLGLNSGF